MHLKDEEEQVPSKFGLFWNFNSHSSIEKNELMDNNMDIKKTLTLGALKATGYESKNIQEELRSNLIEKLRNSTKNNGRVVVVLPSFS